MTSASYPAVCPGCDKPFLQRNHQIPKTCSRKCSAIVRYRTGEHSPNWRGGRTVTPKGYVRLFLPEHPRANAQGYVLEHLVVMGEMIGRPVARHEEVHHKNGKKADNRPENLELWRKKVHH